MTGDDGGDQSPCSEGETWLEMEMEMESLNVGMEKLVALSRCQERHQVALTLPMYPFVNTESQQSRLCGL